MEVAPHQLQLCEVQRAGARPELGKGERMFFNRRLGLFLLVPLVCPPPIPARQYHAPPIPGDGKIHLDVVVTPKSGPPESGLQKQDFTILDNKLPQTILTFQAVRGREASIEVVLVLDDVNTGFANVAYERSEIDKFLRTDGGQLAHPMALAFLTDDGIKVQDEFSSDGNELSTRLDKSSLSLHSIRRSGGLDSDVERLQISMKALFEVGTREANRPGRKIIIWVSPGWPLLSDMLGATQEQQIFRNIVNISTLLREGQITLYSVGTRNRGDYLKEVSKPSQAQMGNLELQVIATQSGGLALSGNDIAALIKQCVADAQAYYEVSFAPPVDQKRDEYHHLEVHVAKPGLTARTRQGYYSQPRPAEKVAAESEKFGGVAGTESAAPADTSDYADARSYVDLPLAQLVERIPELKGLQPAPDEQDLPVILQKLGRSVDEFVREIGDLIAHEDVTQEKLNAKGNVRGKERVQDNYLILHRGYALAASSEYRMDDKGNRLEAIGLEKGYVVTAGFALSCIPFSTVAQPQSRFRYLGEEKMDSRETYVLEFAQQPGEATFFTAMKRTGEEDLNMLTQGILWVDKNSFQIIRMRSDLLAPRNEIRLDQLTTEVAFGEVQLEDVPNPLWLPSNVAVSMEIGKQKFRNLHHYTNYRRYRVSVKIGNPQ
jgi:VWFA-related protein